MSIVRINASKPYDVEILPGLFGSLGACAAPLVKGRNAMLVSDDVVAPLYAEKAVESLRQSGFTVASYIFPHGETSKNGETYLGLLNALASHRLTRSDLVVALGGGVVGDLAGFAAATYLRGIAYIQVPTTLLAMVDSSVGGKTAIDLSAGKNLAGAFYQPRYVLCDPELLTSLPADILQDGCAEVVKYGILGSSQLFFRLERAPVREQLPYIIETCVRMKQDFVSRDEFDTGIRQALNLGHTIGHAVEAASNYSLSHGHCVAIGTAMITRAAARMGYCSGTTCERIISLLKHCALPVNTNYSAEQLFQLAISDKKCQGGTLTLIIPRAIGQYALVKIMVNDLLPWIKAGA